MTAELFLTDAYKKNFEARILQLDGREIVLAETAFYPGGGGQPPDKGQLRIGPVEAAVIDVRRGGDAIVHVLDRRIPGTLGRIGGELDWERRYVHMRYRTALHVLSGVARKSFGAEMTGARMRAGGARIDFFFPVEWAEAAAGEVALLANEALSDERFVRVYESDLEGVVKDENPELARTGPALVPEGVERVRVVEVEGVGARTDGGTHVANTREVGEIVLTRLESRGHQRARVEFTLR